MSVQLFFFLPLISQYAYSLCCPGHRGQHQRFVQALISSPRLGRWHQQENTIISTQPQELYRKVTFQACGCTKKKKKKSPQNSREMPQRSELPTRSTHFVKVWTLKKLQTGLFVRSTSCVDKLFVNVIRQE